MTEREYRASPEDSYSSIKDFLADRKKYYRKHILEETVEEEEDLALRMGVLVDTINLIPESFDEKFYLSTSDKRPTGSMADFVEALYRRVREHSDENGKLDAEFVDVMQMAYNDVKFDKNGNVVAFKQTKASSFEAIVAKFEYECREFYQEILTSRPKGLTVITAQELENGQKIDDELKTNRNTSFIIRMVNDDRKTIINQLILFWEKFGIPYKGMVDKLEIDNVDKYLQPWDIKITWNVEEFPDKYYFYRRSDIQGCMYNDGLLKYRDVNYPGYEVRPMKFIVADSINYNAPLIYPMTEQHLKDGYEGYVRKGRKYVGLDKAMEDLAWHKDNGIWNISKDNFLNSGVAELV